MARITWFEYFIEDAEKDVAFYKEAFGWEARRVDGPMTTRKGSTSTWSGIAGSAR